MSSDSEIGRLAAVVDEAVVTVQLDLDPATTPTRSDIRTRVNSLVDELRRRRPDELSHEATGEFESRIERVEERLSDPHDLGLPPGRRLGAAVFAWNGEVEALPVRQRIPDRVAVGRRPALAAVAARGARADDLLFLVASRGEGRLMRFHEGRAEDVFNEPGVTEQRHHRGGWAQMTLQRWVDNAGAGHIREVVNHLGKLYPRLGRPPILVGADDEARGMITREAPQEVLDGIVGWVGNEHASDADRLIGQVDEALADLDRATERDLLERWQAQQGERAESPDDPLQAVLDQVSDSRVEWLLLPAGADIPVLSCPDCGRLYAHPGHCPVDGAWLETDDAADAIACETLRRSGLVWELLDADNPAVPQDGVAALLRY